MVHMLCSMEDNSPIRCRRNPFVLKRKQNKKTIQLALQLHRGSSGSTVVRAGERTYFLFQRRWWCSLICLMLIYLTSVTMCRHRGRTQIKMMDVPQSERTLHAAADPEEEPEQDQCRPGPGPSQQGLPTRWRLSHVAPASDFTWPEGSCRADPFVSGFLPSAACVRESFALSVPVVCPRCAETGHHYSFIQPLMGIWVVSNLTLDRQSRCAHPFPCLLVSARTHSCRDVRGANRSGPGCVSVQLYQTRPKSSQRSHRLHCPPSPHPQCMKVLVVLNPRQSLTVWQCRFTLSGRGVLEIPGICGAFL